MNMKGAGNPVGPKTRENVTNQESRPVRESDFLGDVALSMSV